jgi:Protein of unknown function (DUF551)
MQRKLRKNRVKEIQSDWVNVNYQLPEPNTKVIIQYGDEDVHIGRIDEDGNWWLYYMNGLDRMDIDTPVTHWMDLPIPTRYG